MSDQIGVEEEENENWNKTTDKGARILKARGMIFVVQNWRLKTKANLNIWPN